MDSTVRKIQPEFSPEVVTQTEPVASPQVTVREKSKVALSKFEKLMIGAVTCVAVAMMMVLVHTSVNVSSSQRQLQDIQANITNIQTDNVDLQQEVSELTSSDRLTTFAKQNGLTFIDGNVRNVTK